MGNWSVASPESLVVPLKVKFDLRNRRRLSPTNHPSLTGWFPLRNLKIPGLSRQRVVPAIVLMMSLAVENGCFESHPVCHFDGIERP